MDTNRDDLDELHKFKQRPLYTEVRLSNGKSFRILGVHLKSKGIFNALGWAAWWAKAEGNLQTVTFCSNAPTDTSSPRSNNEMCKKTHQWSCCVPSGIKSNYRNYVEKALW